MARCKNWFDKKSDADKAMKARKELDHHMLQVGERFFVGKDFQVAKIFNEYQDVKVLGENQASLLKSAKKAASVHVPRKVERKPSGKPRGRPKSKTKAAMKVLGKK